MTQDYGLELTNNSKTSWAFSMPRNKTCIMATETCLKLCYGNGFRYRNPAQKAKRERNFKTVELLLGKGGPESLATNLITLIDQIRPSDWIAAQILGLPTRTPWTLRIHDVGDFYKPSYVRAWAIAIESRPLCSFWFYTRSFLEQELFSELTMLASLPNCQGWLSIDTDNYKAGFVAWAKNKSVWKMALLQEEASSMEDVMEEITQISTEQKFVSFPHHAGGRYVKPVTDKNLFTCPAITGTYRLQSNAAKMRPCQSCSFCLP